MAYERQDYSTGKIITQTMLEHIDDGIIEAQGGYSIGDTITFTAPIVVIGFVTNAQKEICLSVQLPRELNSNQTLNITALKANIRQNGKYIANANYVAGGTDFTASITSLSSGGHYVYFKISSSSAWVNAVNNTECVLQIDTFTATVTEQTQ